MKNFDCQIIGTTHEIDFEPLSEFLWRLLKFDPSIYKLSGERGLFSSLSGLSRVVSSTFDVRKELESATSLCFKSLTSYSTQLLLQPLVNLKLRHGKEKEQILASLEGVNLAIDEHFKECIGDKLENGIANKAQKDAVYEALRSHLKQVISNCVLSFGEIDEETKAQINKLIERINSL